MTEAQKPPARKRPARVTPAGKPPAGKSTPINRADDFPDPGRVAIWGRSGSGKSVFAKELIRDRARLIVFDPQDEYQDHGLRRFTNVDRLREAVAASPSSYRFCLVPRSGDEPARLNALAGICITANEGYAASRRKLSMQITLVVEELNTSFKLMSGETGVPNFSFLCSQGRRRGVGLIGISQRPAEIAMRFRGNTSEAVCFSSSTKTDALAVVAEMHGVAFGELLELRAHEWITFTRATGEVTRGRNSL
jgi:DNA helicase HerA-like ATPase